MPLIKLDVTKVHSVYPKGNHIYITVDPDYYVEAAKIVDFDFEIEFPTAFVWPSKMDTLSVVAGGSTHTKNFYEQKDQSIQIHAGDVYALLRGERFVYSNIPGNAITYDSNIIYIGNKLLGSVTKDDKQSRSVTLNNKRITRINYNGKSLTFGAEWQNDHSIELTSVIHESFSSYSDRTVPTNYGILDIKSFNGTANAGQTPLKAQWYEWHPIPNTWHYVNNHQVVMAVLTQVEDPGSNPTTYSHWKFELKVPIGYWPIWYNGIQVIATVKEEA